MYCRSCGRKLDEGTIFCPSCGTKVKPIKRAEEKEEDIVSTPENESTEEKVAEEVKAKENVESEPETKVEPENESETASEDEAEPESKDEEKPESKDEEKPEPKDEEKPEPKDEEKSEQKDDAETESEDKTETKTEDTKDAEKSLAVIQEQSVAKSVPEQKSKGKNKKVIGAVIAILIVALIVVLAVFLTRGNGGAENYSVYIKNSEIIFDDLKGKKVKITEELGEYISAENLSKSPENIGIKTKITEDGKYIFYPERFVAQQSGTSIYYRSTKNADAKAEKLDDGVRSYTMNRDASLIAYLKGATSTLYVSGISGENEKLDAHVEEYYISEDGTKLIYRTKKGGLYIKEQGKEKEEIANSVQSFKMVGKDFSTIYYLEDEVLYKKVTGKDADVIDEDVLGIVNAYEGDKLYYAKTTDKKFSADALFEDDLKEADAKVSEPNPYAYSSYSAFEKDYYKYLYVVVRNAMREELDNIIGDMEFNFCTLIYCEGKSKNVVSDEVMFLDENKECCYCFEAEPKVVYLSFSFESENKLKYSEFLNDSMIEKVISGEEGEKEFEDKMMGKLFSDFTYNCAIEDENTAIWTGKENELVIETVFSSSGDQIGFITASVLDDDRDVGTLYVAKISDGKISKAESIDTDVYAGDTIFFAGEKIVYFKNVDYSNDLTIADLYIDGEIVASQSPIEHTAYMENDDDSATVYYFENWTKKGGILTAYSTETGKETVISENAYDYGFTKKNELIFLQNFDTSYCEGELMRLTGSGDTEKIDDEVNCIVPIY